MRSSARRAVEDESAVQRARPVGESAQTAAVDVCTADPVVGDVDDHLAVQPLQLDARFDACACLATFASASATMK